MLHKTSFALKFIEWYTLDFLESGADFYVIVEHQGDEGALPAVRFDYPTFVSDPDQYDSVASSLSEVKDVSGPSTYTWLDKYDEWGQCAPCCSRHCSMW